jgi:hypothetical protein
VRVLAQEAILLSEDLQVAGEAHAALGKLCEVVSEDPAALLPALRKPQYAQQLVHLLELAMPQPGALWLAEEVAQLVPALLDSGSKTERSGGVRAVQLLINVKVRLFVHLFYTLSGWHWMSGCAARAVCSQGRGRTCCMRPGTWLHSCACRVIVGW